MFTAWAELGGYLIEANEKSDAAVSCRETNRKKMNIMSNKVKTHASEFAELEQQTKNLSKEVDQLHVFYQNRGKELVEKAYVGKLALEKLES